MFIARGSITSFSAASHLGARVILGRSSRVRSVHSELICWCALHTREWRSQDGRVLPPPAGIQIIRPKLSVHNFLYALCDDASALGLEVIKVMWRKRFAAAAAMGLLQTLTRSR